MGSLSQFMDKAKPFLAVIFLQFGYSGMSIIGKFALDHGLSPHVLVVYRHALAFLVIAPFALVLDKKRRPKMTLSILIKILLLGLLEPVIDQNLYYTGMKLTTATFTAAMCNILPAFAFMMAWAVRLEKVDFKKVHSLAKVVGTIVTVGGAMAMTLLKGPLLDLPWTSSGGHQQSTGGAVAKQDPIKGALMITIGCFAWSAFIILQAITLKAYPAELSVTALICLMGALEGTIPALIMERNNLGAWALQFDSKLLAVVYSGLICSAVAYYVQGLIMKVKGPVFVSAFNPLGMIIVAILGSLILSETMYLGRVIGAVIIVAGLYMVLWGKSKDQVEGSDKGEPVGVKSLDVELGGGGVGNDPKMKNSGDGESE